MGPGNGAETALRVRLDQHVRPRGGVGGWHIVERNVTKAVSVVQIHRTKICAADACRIFQHALEYRLQFAGRAADDLQHFGRRGLLLEGFAQLGRPLLYLLLQIRIGFLQPRAHVVELVGETFQFIAGLDGNTLLEIAAADARSAGAQSPDRHDHAPRQKHSGEHREDQSAQEDHSEALQGLVERRVGFLDRKLHKHGPAERRDRRGRGQDLLALDILCALQQTSTAVPALICAAFTCERPDISVLRNTRLMSGWAINRPFASTT